MAWRKGWVQAGVCSVATVCLGCAGCGFVWSVRRRVWPVSLGHSGFVPGGCSSHGRRLFLSPSSPRPVAPGLWMFTCESGNQGCLWITLAQPVDNCYRLASGFLSRPSVHNAYRPPPTHLCACRRMEGGAFAEGLEEVADCIEHVSSILQKVLLRDSLRCLGGHGDAPP